MNPAGLIIRPEFTNEYSKVNSLIVRAFGRRDESLLVETLRRNPLFIKGLSLVALLDDLILGHILFFPVLIRGSEKVYRSLALATVSVMPEYQRKGIGSALIYSGLDEAGTGKHGSVIVYGHREYFPGFGFMPASSFGIFPPFRATQEAFFAIALQPGGLEGVHGVIEYPPGFPGI